MSDEAKSEKMKQPGPTTSESTVKSLKLQEIHQTHEGSKNELTKTLMAMRAMLESTADAILMTDGDKVTDFNQKYIDMWKVPREILEEGVARKVRQLMGENFADPQHFLARIEEIALIGEVSFDILELKDGRMVERHSQILTIDGQRAGRVWNYRDVTERHLADRGALVTGAQLDYNGRSAGYSRDPSEVINYISAHDNQTLFDNNQSKLPIRRPRERTPPIEVKRMPPTAITVPVEQDSGAVRLEAAEAAVARNPRSGEPAQVLHLD
jgi:PAS domain